MGNIAKNCICQKEQVLYNESKRPFFQESGTFEHLVGELNNQIEAERIEVAQSVYDDSKTLSLSSFKIIRQGSYGKVYLAQKRSSSKYYAIKVLSKDRIDTQSKYQHALEERKILENTNNIFLVSLHYAFQSKSKLYLVMEYVNGGELLQHLKYAGPFDEQWAKFYLAEMILALEFLHSQDIIFRDLKPENILLDLTGHIKLTDFGLAKQLKLEEGAFIIVLQYLDSLAYTICGTPEYIAPEILLKQGYEKTADYWTLGIIIYELMCMRTPFKDNDRNKMFKNILREQVAMQSIFSDKLKDFLKKILNKNYKKRLGYKGIDEIKDHPLFDDINWKKLYKREIQPPWSPQIKDELDLQYFDQNIVQKSYKTTEEISNCYKSNLLNFDGFTLDPSRVSHIRTSSKITLFNDERNQSLNNQIDFIKNGDFNKAERIILKKNQSEIHVDDNNQINSLQPLLDNKYSQTENIRVKVRQVIDQTK